MVEKFQQASDIFAVDDDDRIPDDDPTVIPGRPEYDPDIYYKDDIPLYVDLIPLALPAGSGVNPKEPRFPDPFGIETSPDVWELYDASDPRWYDVRGDEDMDILAGARFSNIKIVGSVQDSSGKWYFGYAGLDDCEPGLLVCEGFNEYLLAHEIGHAAGLLHRGALPHPKDRDCDWLNPVYDSGHALMSVDQPGPEINRWEFIILMPWSPTTWDKRDWPLP